MTTLQARSWARVAQRATKAPDKARIQEIARALLGFAIMAAMLVAAVAVRVLAYVHL